MKQLTEKVCKREFSWAGRSYIMCRQRFEIEPADVGIMRSNFLGKAYKVHTFVLADVGQEIEVLTDGGDYRSWYFIHHEDLKTQKP